ncbi:MAG: 30S ribosomal protein S5 [Bacilli bacterium]|nr:30S ribosomal protein S5 [Bacilli bacterium]
MRRDERKEYEERVVDINRISKTVQGGRHMRFSALVVIGDKKGKYGFAMEKSGEVPDAIKKSLEAARHNMYNIHIVKGATIAHEVMGKYGATKVYLKPAPAGTGIIAGGPVRAILELSGLKNVVSKVYGARASINVIRATHNAISQLKSYRQVRELRGLVDEHHQPEEAK